MEHLFDLIRHNLPTILFVLFLVLPSIASAHEKKKRRERSQQTPRRSFPDPLDEPTPAHSTPAHSTPAHPTPAHPTATRPTAQTPPARKAPSSPRELLEEMLRPIEEARQEAERRARAETAAPPPPPVRREPPKPAPRPVKTTGRDSVRRQDLGTVGPKMVVERSSSRRRSVPAPKSGVSQSGSSKAKKWAADTTARSISRARKLVGERLDRSTLRRAVLLKEVLDPPLALREGAQCGGAQYEESAAWNRP